MKSVTSPGAKPPRSFRELLQRELAERCAQNPQYSLRAFAKYLQIDHSSLSQILRGKRRLTADKVRTMGERLGLDHATIDTCVAIESQRHGELGAARHVTQLYEDATMVLAQWQHCAILELTRLDSFRPDVRWIGRVLGLSTDDVNVAVTRLLHLGLLSMSAADVWRDESGDAELTSTEFSHTVLQLLADRLRGLEAAELDGARSFFSATTLAVQASRLPAVVEYLQSVRNQLAELAAEHGHSGDDVYRFDVALFPLTNMNQTRKEPDGSTSETVSDHREEPGPGC